MIGFKDLAEERIQGHQGREDPLAIAHAFGAKGFVDLRHG
jgi:hypothetical protein